MLAYEKLDYVPQQLRRNTLNTPVANPNILFYATHSERSP